MWMVRAEGGRLVEAFRARGVVALGWTRLAPIVLAMDRREALIDAYAALDPARAQLDRLGRIAGLAFCA